MAAATCSAPHSSSVEGKGKQHGYQRLGASSGRRRYPTKLDAKRPTRYKRHNCSIFLQILRATQNNQGRAGDASTKAQRSKIDRPSGSDSADSLVAAHGVAADVHANVPTVMRTHLSALTMSRVAGGVHALDVEMPTVNSPQTSCC